MSPHSVTAMQEGKAQIVILLLLLVSPLVETQNQGICTPIG